MAELVVFTSVTLDGVMQAPGRPDEDPRGGFEHGGWAEPYAASAEAGGSGSGSPQALLLGRRTYEDFHRVWPKRKDNPFSAILDAMPKYVASRTLREPLVWQNSTLLRGDAAEAVAALKREGTSLLTFGGGELVQCLMRSGLVDVYVLLIHPLVLGSGRRMFPEGSPTSALRLVDSRITSKGVVIATYVASRPAVAAAQGGVAAGR